MASLLAGVIVGRYPFALDALGRNDLLLPEPRHNCLPPLGNEIAALHHLGLLEVIVRLAVRPAASPAADDCGPVASHHGLPCPFAWPFVPVSPVPSRLPRDRTVPGTAPFPKGIRRRERTNSPLGAVPRSPRVERRGHWRET